MSQGGSTSGGPRKGLTLDDLIVVIDRHERNPSNIPKVDIFHFCGERVSEWLERVEQALVGRSDVVNFQRILQYVLHSYHQEVKKVIDAAQGSWERFKEGMQRKYRLRDGPLTTTDLEAMNKEDFTTIGAFVQEFKKRARKVHGISEEAQCAIFLGLLTASEAVELTRHGGGSTKLTRATIDKGVEVGCLDQVEQRQVRLQRQKRKERDATAFGTPGVKRIVADVLAQLGYATESVVQKRVVTGVQVKGKKPVIEEVLQKELWKKEEPVPQHLTKAQRKLRNLAQGGQRSAICQHCDQQGHTIRFCNIRWEDEKNGLISSTMDGNIYDQFGEFIDRRLGGVRAEAQRRAAAGPLAPATFRLWKEKKGPSVGIEEFKLWQEKEESPIGVEEVGSDEEVTQGPRGGSKREEPIIIESDNEGEEEKMKPPSVLLGKMEYYMDKVGRGRLKQGSQMRYKTVDKKCGPVPILVTEDEKAYYKRERRLIRRMRESALTGPCRINEENEGKLIIGEPDFLLPQERTLMVELMKRKHRAYAFSDEERGRLDVDKIPMIRIHTMLHEPWSMRRAQYPNPDEEKKVADYLDGKICTHVADYSSGPYVSPWFCFIKPNGTLRWVQDLQRLNAVTVRDAGGLPNADALSESWNVDEVPESQDDEFEEGEIKEAFRAEEYDGIYLELELLLSCEMRLRDVSDRAQRMLQRYLVRDGHLFVRREVGNPRRFVCGRNCQIDVIAALHDGIARGHRGVQATYAKISELCYWDGMMDMIGKFCRSYVPCQERSRLRQGESLHPRLEREVGAVVHLDLLFMPLGDQGYNYIFDARDNLSGFVDGRAIRTKAGPVLVSCIEEYYLRYPFVREFIIDKGSEFTCQEVQKLLSRYDFTKTAMPRGGRGTRPPRRPLGASGGYERHGPRHRESTPEYGGDDIELFLDSFWEHARRMGWTVTQGIDRLSGVDRFEGPVARIRREATTRSEMEMRMQELRPSPVGPDGRPIRLEVGNALDFIPAFEWFMHLAAHALEHPDLEEPAPTEPRQEPCQSEKEVEAEIPKRVDLRTRERAPAGETTEEKRARRTRRIEEVWQERQRLEAAGALLEQQQERQRSEAAGALPGQPPSEPAKAPEILEMWRDFWEQRGEELPSPTRAGFGVARKAEERLDRKIKFLAKTTFDRHLLLESDLAGKKTKEAGHGVRLEAMEVEIQELRALVASQAAIIESLRQQSQGKVDKPESSRQGEQWQPGHRLPGQTSATEPRQEPPMGRVILEPEEATARREAEREAFEFRAPTELAMLPVAAADPVVSLTVEEGLPPSRSEPAQGSAEGSMGVLLETVHTMQEEASLISPERRIEEPLEREMGIEVEGVIKGGLQRLGTLEYGPEGIEDRPGPSTQEVETREGPLDMPQSHELSREAREAPSSSGSPRGKKRSRKWFDTSCFYSTKEGHQALQCPNFLKDKAEGKVTEEGGRMYDRKGRRVERSSDGGRVQLYRQNQEEMSDKD
ncbi:hypothetical protein CBR_g31055 [Chara braunii]|uniref:Integrase catalytic domain-containing protein n=1 Tax=Chara braunii TaxID=69332 RepID=A0A388LE60_CHABU|nr:hypothetical protein CBR_g31055 [Chara braunii]|eukprot:GBG80596.1 hypothetical protein CBR_g31055 [Chara braunii]